MKLFFISLVILGLLFSCAVLHQEKNENIFPDTLQTILEIHPEYVPQKCCFSPKDKTVFIWEKNTTLIHIYRGNNQINTIGGSGFEDSNFSKLVDITITPDGNLLALDAFQSRIKKFDADGRLIADFEVSNLSNPILFDISADETLYIYDDSRKEIVVFNGLTGKESFAFGKFFFISPVQLVVSRNYVTVYEKKGNITHIFDILGQFEEDVSGYVQFDKNQRFELQKFYLKSLVDEGKFAVSPYSWNGFSVKNGYFVLFSNNKILIALMKYEKK